jgi:outer membrane protein
MFNNFYCKSAVILLTCCLFAVPPATAQESNKYVIGVLDIPAILRDALVIQDINKQVNSLEEKLRAEVKAKEADIREQKTALDQQKVILSPAIFAEKQKELAKKAKSFQLQLREKGQQLQLSKLKALDEVKQYLAPIVKTVSEQKGATLVFETSEILFADQSLNITREVLEELNGTVKKIDVNLVPLKKSCCQIQVFLTHTDRLR